VRALSPGGAAHDWLGRAVLCLVAIAPLAVGDSRAAQPDGDVEATGSVESQNIVRHSDVDEFHFIQQRNTLRLGLRWDVVRDGRRGAIAVPAVGAVQVLLLYRAVYDSVYDYAPILRERDLRGRKPGRAAQRDLADLPRGVRDAIKSESQLREAYVDVTLRSYPIRLRIGRQQIVWGEADLFRMLDRANPLDTSWHSVEEIPPPSFGWDELRIPLWMIRGWDELGDAGPLSDVRYEMYWTPGDWRPVKVAFLPRPWGIRLPNPLTNREDGAFFAPFSGVRRLDRSTLFQQGNYRRTPWDNSQVGLQLSWTLARDIRTSVYYFYQRWAGDDGTPSAPLRGLPDTERGRQRTQDLLHRGTLPVEYITPYIHTIGMSGSHYVETLRTTLRVETVYDFGIAIFNRDKATTFAPLLPGLSRRDYWKGMLAFDRPIVASFAGDDRVIFLTGQWFVHHIIHNKDSLTGPLDLPTAGARSRPFCGSPSDRPCPDPRGNGSFRDDVRSWESLITLAAFTNCRGGTVLPVAGIVLDPVNSYSMHVFWNVGILVGSGVSVDLTQRYFATLQRDVQKGPFNPWLFGTMRGRSETALRVTYRF
jgi:hypothetical protein